MPATALGQIQTVIANRTSVLSQLAGLAVPTGNSEAVQLRSMLQTALQDSIQADNYYSEWMNDLTNDYFDGLYNYCPTAPRPPMRHLRAHRVPTLKQTRPKQHSRMRTIR